jgi:imidazolonepropionase-like amidohydrolase
MATAALARQAFAQARDYAAKRGNPPQGPVDPKLEPMAAAMAGKIPVVVRAERRADILAGLELARAFGFGMILAGGSDAPHLAAELARRKVPVLIAIDQQPDGVETAGARYENAALLQAAGVKIAFQSNEVTLARNLVPNVGLAVAYGLPPEAALRALTLSAAEIFGVADRLGSLEPGKEATFVLTRGDPLQVRSRIVSTFVRGRRYLPRSYQTALCEAYIAPKGKGIACESQ